jgi:hypothetical protein
MACRSRPLDRSWLYFGAGLAVFAVTDSVYPAFRSPQGTYVAGTLIDVGWIVAHVAGGGRGLAAGRAYALRR